MLPKPGSLGRGCDWNDLIYNQSQESNSSSARIHPGRWEAFRFLSEIRVTKACRLVEEIIFYSTYQHVKDNGNELQNQVAISSVTVIAEGEKKYRSRAGIMDCRQVPCHHRPFTWPCKDARSCVQVVRQSPSLTHRKQKAVRTMRLPPLANSLEENSSHKAWIRQITECSWFTLSVVVALLCWWHMDQEQGG